MKRPILALAFVAGMAADAATTVAPQINSQPIGSGRALDARGTIVSTQRDTLASSRLILARSSPPALAAQAEFMSVGPMGPWESDTLSSGGFSFVDESFRRLRVTLGSCERSAWLWIDDIVTGRADSRSVKAEYVLDFGSGIQGLAGLQGHSIRRPDPTDQPIRWLSPTSFELVMRADTLVVEQLADSLFNITLRTPVQ